MYVRYNNERSLTSSEKRAVQSEIRKQFAEFDRKHEFELDAMVLWVLHERYGFGRKRLRQFYDIFTKEMDDLVKRYDMENEDRLWLCTYKLKQYGIDLEEWFDEREKGGV